MPIGWLKILNKSQEILQKHTDSEMFRDAVINASTSHKLCENYINFREEVKQGRLGKTAQFWVQYMGRIWLICTSMYLHATKQITQISISHVFNRCVPSILLWIIRIMHDISMPTVYQCLIYHYTTPQIDNANNVTTWGCLPLLHHKPSKLEWAANLFELDMCSVCRSFF